MTPTGARLAAAWQILVLALLVATPLRASAVDPATVTVTMVGNAAGLGATKNDRVGELDQPSLVCGLPDEGAPDCSLAAGDACCKRIISAPEQGKSALLIAQADRGVTGGASADFGGWGGACTQDPVACPYDLNVTDPAFIARVCRGGADHRGQLLFSQSGLRTDPNAIFGCELVVPSSGNVDVIMYWNKYADGVYPPTCTFEHTDLECTSPLPTTTVTSSTTTTLPASPDCGDPNLDGDVTATDALQALSAAAGSLFCPACYCDVNGDGNISASDALELLQRAIDLLPGRPTKCPACQ